MSDVERAKDDIERTRAELQETVDELTDRLDPRVRAAQAGQAVRARAGQGAAKAQDAVAGRAPMVIAVGVSALIAVVSTMVLRRRRNS